MSDKGSKRKAVLSSFPLIPKGKAITEIQRIAQEDTGRVFILDHARLRMMERGITDRQVFKVLRHGDLVEGPEWDVKNDERGWKCRFRRIAAGECVNVVAKLVERGNGSFCLVVTVYGE